MRVLSVLRTSAGLDEYPLLRALMSADCDLVNLDDRHYGFHAAPGPGARLARRWQRGAFVRQFNDDLCRYVQSHRPQLMLIFKAPHLRAEPVLRARALGCRTIALYPDLDPRVEGPDYLEMLRAVDEFHFTKPHLSDRFRSAVRPDARPMLPPYSSRELGEPGDIDPQLGVSFVGHWSAGKQRSLQAFVRRHAGPLTVVGEGWERWNAVPGSAPATRRSPLYGGPIRSLYRHSVCTLGLLMEGRPGGWGGDELTSRSVLVPAAGGLLLHPRTAGAEALYGRDCPLLFDDLDEAAERAAALARDPAARVALAQAQRQRVLEQAPSAEGMVQSWLAG